MSERLQESLPKTICRNEIYYELRGEQYYPCLLVPPEPDASEEDQLRFIIRQMADDGHIAFSSAVELSYLARDEQAELWDLIGREDATPSLSQALRMKRLSREAKLTPEVLYAILTEEKPNQKEQVRIKTESLRKYFPRNYSAQQMEREILKLLETRYRTRNRGER